MIPRIFSISILSIVLITCKANAQHYSSMPEANVVWQENTFFTSQPCLYRDTNIYYFDGDTTIDNLLYKKLYFESVKGIGCNWWGSLDSIHKQYTGGFRQDTANRKVFIYLKDSSAEHVLYDFNLSVGDTISYLLPDLSYPNVFGYGHPVVTAIDSLLINGSYHRRYLYDFSFPTNSGWNQPNALIEGIGNTRGFLYARTSYLGGDSWINLNCVTFNGDKIFGDGALCYSPGFTDGISAPTPDNPVAIQLSESDNAVLFIVHNPFHQVLTVSIINSIGQICYQVNVVESSSLILPRNMLPDGVSIAALFSERQLLSRIKFVNY